MEFETRHDGRDDKRSIDHCGFAGGWGDDDGGSLVKIMNRF
jgi:hypothetical protein